MLDFLMITTRSTKKDVIEIYPKFIIKKSSDLMIRGRDFYAIWDESKKLWSTDEEDVIRMVDQEVKQFVAENKNKFTCSIKALYMWDAESGMIDKWHRYCQKQMRDCFHALDEKIIFSNVVTKKEDYASKKLNYPLEDGPHEAYDELMSVLYSPEERKKIEWAVGSIVSGDSKYIQKFLVMYGSAGTGKSTVLNIIQDLFEGYYSVFDAKALGSTSNMFALEAFSSNPLVAIQHDGDLSRIEDNTRLNSIVSHELMTVNEKFKNTYASKFNCFLFMGTNKPVKITDAKSGILRRLIDVSPTGEKIPVTRYNNLISRVKFELGAIANHCLNVYKDDPKAYDGYVPVSMMGSTNDFYNFVMDSYDVFKREDSVTLKTAWEMYKVYCDDARVGYQMSQRAFKEELKNYFDEFIERRANGDRTRNIYQGFKHDKFETKVFGEESNDNSTNESWLKFDCTESLLDKMFADCPAQLSTSNETPKIGWDNVTTTLKDIDTTKLHYVRVPDIHHVMIDFDLKNEKGEKDYERNLEAASKFPPTYAELSKGGSGIHLHYIYVGDVDALSRIYDDDVEVKVYKGKSSIRRRLSKCNDIPIATINSGLPLKIKKGDKMVSFETIKSEKALRTLIKRNLNKEIHPATKPSVDFIHDILEEAYNSGLIYDVSDMRNSISAFASSSTHQADYCLKLVGQMKFKSEEERENTDDYTRDLIAFYDVEVFPNLFVVVYKIQGEDKLPVKLINPSPKDIEDLCKLKLIGFNNRKYDNHILYARMMGYTNEQLYRQSQKIINKVDGAFFREAYNLSYTDIYDFASASNKMSLKKWEIKLGIHHQELGLPWNKPVPEKLWPKVAEYCINDVIATEAVFNHLKGDWTARQILTEICKMFGIPATYNDPTNSLTTKFIFGSNKNPRLIYTNLATGEQE